MSERGTTAEALEAALRSLGEIVAFPATGEELSASVAARIAVPRQEREPGRVYSLSARRAARPLIRPAWHRAVAATAAVLVIASGVLVGSPSARDAVAGLLGLRGVRIERVPSLVGSPRLALGHGLDLGQRLPLDQATARVTYRILVPEPTAFVGAGGLGPPDEVYLAAGIPGGQVSLVYRARAGLHVAASTGAALLVSEFRGSVHEEFLGKSLGPGTELTSVSVNGGRGYWISGNPHEIYLLDESGRIRQDTVRLSGNVLLWEQGDLVVRIESQLGETQALAIARSMR
jgi:hypothetical protein